MGDNIPNHKVSFKDSVDPDLPYGNATDGRPKLDELKGSPELYTLAQALERQYYFACFEDNEEFRRYVEENGIYGHDASTVIKRELLGRFPWLTSHEITEVEKKIKWNNLIPRSEFDAEPDWIHVKNGWVNINTLEFVGHSPYRYSLNTLPVKYNPQAKCPAFIKFLRETLEPEYIGIVAKLLGYIVYKKSVYHKAFMFTGEGANGKSTLINTIEAFVGKHNRSAVSLQDLTENRFKMAELYGKMVNLFADLSSKEIKNSGVFKMLVSGDPISAERKYQQSFTFENYAKIIVSANKIPESQDRTYAYMRRWVIIPFNRVFEGGDADEHLLEKLTTEQELSGILNLALRNLRKLKAEQGFNETNIEEIRRQYELGASRIWGFIEEKCELKPESDDYYVESALLKEEFRKYCKVKGTRYFDERQFGEELKKLGIRHKQKGSRTKRTYYEFGIRLKEPVLRSLDKQQTTFTNTEIMEKVAKESPKDSRTAVQVVATARFRFSSRSKTKVLVN